VSRSWIDRARGLVRPSARAGLAIGRDYVGFAELARAPGGWRITALDQAPLDTPLFAGAPGPDAHQGLARALARVAGALRRRYVPVHVSVPDAVMRWATFELDELPKNAAARVDLVRFRFGRQGTNGAHAYACQPLGSDGGKHLLFGMALDDAWRAVVGEALAAAGIVPWSVSGNACRQFNRFHDRITAAGGALVALAPDAWSLWLWDARGRPRYGRGRWRDAAGPGDIAVEAERAILAYVHGGRERSVERVYVAGGAETEAVVVALDARLREPCVRLAADQGGVSGAEGATACGAVALAAALEQ